eukprot:g23048.t1
MEGSFPPSRHAQYGEHWGEGAARCFSLEADILDEDHAVRLMPVPDSFVCPISAAIMVDPVATVDGSVYERGYIERWFRERRQDGNRITSPITGQELPSATLMPLVALQRAIEEPPEELRDERCFGENRAEENVTSAPGVGFDQSPTSAASVGRSFEEAAAILQTDLFEKQAVHASTQDKLKRLKQANKDLLRGLQQAEQRIAQLESQLGQSSSPFQAAASSKVKPESDAPTAAPRQSETQHHEPVGDADAGAEAETPSGPSETRAPKEDAKPCVGAGVHWGAQGLLAFLMITSLVFLLGPFRWQAVTDVVPVGRREVLETSHLPPMEENPALTAQLRALEEGNDDEKQKVAFMWDRSRLWGRVSRKKRRRESPCCLDQYGQLMSALLFGLGSLGDPCWSLKRLCDI